MSHIDAAIHQVGSLDQLAARDTAATRLDPRAKLMITVTFVAVVASFGRLELARLVPLAAAFLVVVPLCDVPWRPLLVRLALASPFALGVALFEPFLDRAPAVVLGDVTLSRGALAFLMILSKFGLSLGAALLLVATTGFDAVCAALGRLGVPRLLVAQLSLTYRYLFVLGDEAGRMVRAHNLRAPGLKRPTARTFATLLGHLLVRAMDRAERIHRAMQARGFDGRLPIRREWRLHPADAGFMAAALAFLLLVRLVNVSALVGLPFSGAFR